MGSVRKIALMQVEHGGEDALVASKGGAPEHPEWYHNLVAHPDEVTVQDGPAPFAVRVRRVTGDKRRAWWARAVAAYPPYADYQRRRTARFRCSWRPAGRSSRWRDVLTPASIAALDHGVRSSGLAPAPLRSGAVTAELAARRSPGAAVARGVRRQASGVGRRASGVGRRASGVGRRASGVGRRVVWGMTVPESPYSRLPARPTGTASLDPAIPIVAGSYGTWQLTFTCGPRSVATGAASVSTRIRTPTGASPSYTIPPLLST